MKKGEFSAILKNGILTQNPTLVQLLGTCPTLAVTTSVQNGVAMGLSATVILVCSNFLISLLRNIIPKQVRIASYIVLISGFVTAAELLIKAYLPQVDRSLGVFLPLIVVNCILLARAEAFACKNSPGRSALDGLAMGLGFTLALIGLSVIREALGAGTVASFPLFGESFQPALIMILPPGAFFTLAAVIALVNRCRQSAKGKKTAEKIPAVHGTKEGEAE